jgi:hypothetical protein
MPPPDAAARAALALLSREDEVRYAEVRFVDERTERLCVRDGRPEQVTTGASRGVGIRVLGARTWGFACTADVTEAGLVRAARAAVGVAKASSRMAPHRVVFPELVGPTGRYETPWVVDPFAVSLEDKMAELERPVLAMLAKGGRIQSAEAWMEWTRLCKRLLSTERGRHDPVLHVWRMRHGGHRHRRRRAHAEEELPDVARGRWISGRLRARGRARSHGAHRSSVRRSHRSPDGAALPRGASAT